MEIEKKESGNWWNWQNQWYFWIIIIMCMKDTMKKVDYDSYWKRRWMDEWNYKCKGS
jgi:hypothetical protein